MTRFDMERAVFGSELPPTSRLLLLALLARADASTVAIPERFTPSLTELSRATGLARSSVVRLLDELSQQGWIVRHVPNPEAARRGTKTQYTLHCPSPTVEPELGPQSDHPSSTTGLEVVRPSDIPSPTIGRKRRQPQSETIPARASEPWDSRPVQNAVIEELERLSGKVVPIDHARREAKRILDGRSFNDAVRYVRMSISNAAAQGRLADHLPTPQPPQWRREETPA